MHAGKVRPKSFPFTLEYLVTDFASVVLYEFARVSELGNVLVSLQIVVSSAVIIQSRSAEVAAAAELADVEALLVPGTIISRDLGVTIIVVLWILIDFFLHLLLYVQIKVSLDGSFKFCS